jgi:spermidine/putrescine transport system ATP-binding protein
MSQPSVEVVSARKSYGAEVTALDGVSVAVARGEFFTLLGPSGCGKTTLLRLLAGFETPDEGAIRIGGRDVTADPPHKRPVNTVFQSYALFPHLTVARNVSFGLEMRGTPRRDADARAREMLELVELSPMADRRPAQLSGGQQQRVALARALAPAPEVLLLDEPLSALDLKLRQAMRRELARIQHETGITFVFVTHDQEEALAMSDRIAVMRDGRILQTGTPRDIYEAPANRFVADFIGETNFLTGRAASGTLHLASGETLPAPGAQGETTLAVRPEQVRLHPAGAPGTLAATVTDAVYMGTDTHCHLALSDGTPLVARLPATPGAAPPQRGTPVGLAFAEGALRPVG